MPLQSKLSICQLDQLGHQSSIFDDQSTNRDWQIEAPRPSAAWIEEQYTLAIFHQGPMRVTEDHG